MAVAEEADQVYTVLQHPPIWGLPSSSVECIQLQAYLRLAAVNFTVENCPSQPDSERLPALEHRVEVAYAHRAGGVVGFLREARSIDLDAALREEERAELLALTALLDSVLADASLHQLWMEPENADVAQEAYASGLPWPLSSMLTWQKWRSVRFYFEAKGAQPSQVYGRAAAAYGALATRLGSEAQFFRERPTSLDAALCAHVLFQLRAPLVASPLRAELERHPALVRYAEQLHEHLFGPAPPREAPPFTRTQGQPRPRSSAAPGGEKKDKKELTLQRRARYFLLAQAGAVLLYVLFSSLSFEVEEDDGDDDDGEEL